jgi:hypothetical protein
LLSTRDFWRLLMTNDIPFSALTEAFGTIEASHSRAEKTYKTMMERCCTASLYCLVHAEDI